MLAPCGWRWGRHKRHAKREIAALLARAVAAERRPSSGGIIPRRRTEDIPALPMPRVRLVLHDAITVNRAGPSITSRPDVTQECLSRSRVAPAWPRRKHSSAHL